MNRSMRMIATPIARDHIRLLGRSIGPYYSHILDYMAFFEIIRKLLFNTMWLSLIIRVLTDLINNRYKTYRKNRSISLNIPDGTYACNWQCLPFVEYSIEMRGMPPDRKSRTAESTPSPFLNSSEVIQAKGQRRKALSRPVLGTLPVDLNRDTKNITFEKPLSLARLITPSQSHRPSVGARHWFFLYKELRHPSVMLRPFTLAVLSFVLHLSAVAQVKPEYLFNTNTPYGTLDIRTKISATRFYYLEEGKTFSFRESAPGTRTHTFLDMTPWDSGPYKEGNLRKRDGNKDDFIMNYRLLPPVNYVPSFEEGYPLIVLMHGAAERGNCFYDDCYHADWNYDPNVNSPPAPNNADHKLLNNDDHLTQGGKQHLAARDRAGDRLPGDASMPASAFPGFILIPQMLNVWDSLVVEDVIRLVRLHCERYNIDQNRIYIHGLSIGGYATYEAIKRAPWLFAAALPMSAVTEAANIFKHRQQDNVAHIPLWIFQGAKDDEPSPAFTQKMIDNFRSAGALIKYSVYPKLAHRVWDRAYNEPEFFSWMLGKTKTNLHPWAGITNIDTSKNVYPKLMLAAGFLAYQWEKDGVIMAGERSHALTVVAPGVYRARFSRVSESPGASDWNLWSAQVKITGDEPGDPGGDGGGDDDNDNGGNDGNGGGEDDGNDDGDDGGDDDSGGDDDGDDDGSDDDGEGNNSGGDGDDDDGGHHPGDPDEGPVTGIEDENTFAVSVHPNPANSGDINIYLSSFEGQSFNIALVDMLGHVLYDKKYNASELFDAHDIRISLPLADGIYILIVKNDAHEERLRVMIRNSRN